ncbi:MAG: response regulator [Calditrichaeota bacterium]|nr:MAG: response regulator [Calditrichota bacterium]
MLLARSKYKILVIEDDLVFRRSLSKALSKNNYNVFVASSYEEASELCDQMHFHLVIIDIRYSNKAGLDCQQRLRVLHPETKLIIISTFNRVEFEKKFLTRDFDAYLMKPVKRVELLKTVRRTLMQLPTI